MKKTTGPIGKLPSKPGSDYLFKNPEDLWDAACLYFDQCDQNIVYLDVIRGSEVAKVSIGNVCVYTIKGLCAHLGCGVRYFNRFERQLEDKNDPESEHFKTIFCLIRDVISDNKFTVDAAGAR